MAWTEQEVSQFQIGNDASLAEVNETLRPDSNLSGKVGVFLPGQAGDLITAMSVLKYREIIFGGKEIIWFANSPNCDCLKYAPVTEVRPWPWAGNGLPEGSPDYWPMLMTPENRLNQTLKKNFEATADLDDGYFPAPYMLPPQKRHGWDYPNCSRKVFGVPDDWEWRPLLNFSNLEKQLAFVFIENLPKGKKIFFETFAGSSQSLLWNEMVVEAMRVCREKWKNCIFIFASHKYLRLQEAFPDNFFNQIGVYSCSRFSVRQCALISDYTDIIISVSSGLTVACSRWGRHLVPCLQFCGSEICGTKTLFSGEMIQVFTDNKSKETAAQEFYDNLSLLLNKYN